MIGNRYLEESTRLLLESFAFWFANCTGKSGGSMCNGSSQYGGQCGGKLEKGDKHREILQGEAEFVLVNREAIRLTVIGVRHSVGLPVWHSPEFSLADVVVSHASIAHFGWRGILIGFALAMCLFGAPVDVLANCGDWLASPRTSEQVLARLATLETPAAGSLGVAAQRVDVPARGTSPQSVPPCRGPHCRRGTVPVSPVVPMVTTVISEHAVTTMCVRLLPTDLFEVCLIEADLLPMAVLRDRLERPPQAR